MDGSSPPSQPPAERADALAAHADTRRLATMLASQHDDIIQRWLQAVAAQPFHLGRPDRAVADHIPPLLIRLLDIVATGVPERDRALSPAHDPAYLDLARRHAQARAAQGLSAGDVVIEFRLLRQTIWAVLREHEAGGSAIDDVLGAEIMLNDAIDAAIGVGLDYFTEAIRETLEEFASLAAHDLGNVLTALKGTLRLLTRRAQAGRLTPDGMAPSLVAMTGQADRMQRLIQNLVDVARIRAGQLIPQRHPTALLPIIDRVVALLGEEARRRVSIVARDHGIIGNWEESRIEQVVENLIGNALKYAPVGPVRVTVALNNDTVRIEVADDGIGLSDEDRAQLFRRFFRSPGAVERGIEGSGLGLYICRGIVEAHGGSITASSSGFNQGTTMTVTLPIG